MSIPLDPEYLSKYLDMEPDFCGEVTKALRALNENKAARALMDCAERLLSRENVEACESVCLALMGHARAFLHIDGGLALACLLADALPQAVGWLGTMGIGDAIVVDTFRDFRRWADVYHEKNGQFGIEELPWVLYPYARRMVKLGRLMYEPAQFAFPYYVFRDEKTGKLSVWAAAGLGVLGDGCLEGVNARKDAPASLTTLSIEGEILVGYAADVERGVILPKLCSFPLAGQRLILWPGARVLNVHIPAEGALKPGAVDDSLRAARRVFADRGIETEAVVCESWLLDPHLPNFAPESGNSVAFMRRFAKFPVRCPAPSAGKYVFGMRFAEPQWQDAPQDTTMRRNLKAYLKAGGQLYDTGGVLIIPD